MRALLIVNHNATTTRPRVRDVIARALSSAMTLEVAETTHRGHAEELAAAARQADVDVLVTLGGDGTVNEAVNGLLAAGPAADGPMLAAVPGGSANVLVRTLGLPTDPVEATAEILAALREGRRRTIGLGRLGERWFTFCAGIGLDAEVVADVEERRGNGLRASSALYVRATIRRFFLGTERRKPPLRLHRPGAAPVERLFLVIVSNSNPWTYLGNRPVQPNPEASFDTGLDVLALRRLGVVPTVLALRRMLYPAGGPPRGRHVVRLHDLAEATVLADRPIGWQVDGEYVGRARRFELTAVPNALAVVC